MALIAGLYLGDVLQADRALLVAMAVVAAVGVLGFLVDLRNPNRDLEANRRTAEQEIAAQRVRVLRPGMPLAPGFEPSARKATACWPSDWRSLALLALALPELMRRQSAWPLNADWYPPVAGPGDETYLYLPDSISSIKGYWTGKSKVTAQVAPRSRPASRHRVVHAASRLGHAIDRSSKANDRRPLGSGSA